MDIDGEYGYMVTELQNDKRRISALLPYRKSESGFEFYLQRRSLDARILAGKLGLFGGGSENDETPEETLIRELREELEYTPVDYYHFARYEGPFDIVDVFLESVLSDFERSVVVHEGEYGTFMSMSEVLRRDDVSRLVQLAVEQFALAEGIPS